MVLSFTHVHVFKHPVDQVSRAYRSLHEQQADMTVTEHEPIDEDSSMTCARRTLTSLNPFPRFFQRIKCLQVETFQYFEDVWTQSEESRVWIRSRNLTLEDDITIGRVVYLSPNDSNKNWTTWEDITALDFERCGKFGSLLELYLKRSLGMAKLRDVQLMESILKSLDEE